MLGLGFRVGYSIQSPRVLGILATVFVVQVLGNIPGFGRTMRGAGLRILEQGKETAIGLT